MALRVTDLQEMAETAPMSSILEELSLICRIREKTASAQKTKRNGPPLSDQDCYRITADELQRAARRFHPER